MKKNIWRDARLCPSVLALACSAVSAQGTPATLNPVVVTATRSAVPLRDVLADVTVIERDVIDRHAGSAVSDLLRTLPGIQTTRTGGPAGTTGLFIRGAETRFTAVLIDGVRVDSQSTGGPTWEALPLSQIDRIEVVRGPVSGVYGSDAIGGVVQIFTRKGEPGTRFELAAGAGSYSTSNNEAGVSGAIGPVDYAVSLFDDRSKGYNAMTVNSNPDRDGYRRDGGSGRLGWQIVDDHRLEVSVLRSHLDGQYDSNARFDPTALTKDSWSVHEVETGRAAWTARWLPEWTSTLSAGRSEDYYATRPDPYETRTRITSYLWQNDVRIGSHSVQAALERREDELRNSSVAAEHDERTQDGVALGYGWRSGSIAVQANARYDHNDAYGSATTGSLAAGIDVAPGWRVQSSVGNAFRAPTLFQQYSRNGVASLAPERSRLNVDLALVRRAGSFEGSATIYRNRLADMIVYGGPGPCVAQTNCYENVGNVLLEGVTLAGRYTFDGLRISGSFDYLSPKNRDTGLDLARRARRSAVLGVDKDIGDATVGVQLQSASERRDTNTATSVILGGYTIVNADLTQKLSKELRLVMRVDNLFDKQYTTASTYNTNPQAFFVGLRWSPEL